jgi:Flp pilus assembly protein TadB
MRTARQPVVITDAEQSLDDQLRSRQIRYLVMMSIRAVCLILAAVLVSLKVPLLGWWLAMCVLAMILLPWLAVLIANDRPAKPEHRLVKRARHSPQPPPPNAVTEHGEPKVIDVEL